MLFPNDYVHRPLRRFRPGVLFASSDLMKRRNNPQFGRSANRPWTLPRHRKNIYLSLSLSSFSHTTNTVYVSEVSLVRRLAVGAFLIENRLLLSSGTRIQSRAKGAGISVQVTNSKLNCYALTCIEPKVPTPKLVGRAINCNPSPLKRENRFRVGCVGLSQRALTCNGLITNL